MEMENSEIEAKANQKLPNKEKTIEERDIKKENCTK